MSLSGFYREVGATLYPCDNIQEFGEASILVLLMTALLGIDDQKDVVYRVQGNLWGVDDTNPNTSTVWKSNLDIKLSGWAWAVFTER
jgi:type II secretory pathway component PulC